MTDEIGDEPQAGNALVGMVFWLLWLLLLFVTGVAGLFSLAGVGMLSEGISAATVAGLVVNLAAIAALVYSLVQSFRLGAGHQGRGRPGDGKAWLFLLGLPLIAGFVWFGGCILMTADMRFN